MENVSFMNSTNTFKIFFFGKILPQLLIFLQLMYIRYLYVNFSELFLSCYNNIPKRTVYLTQYDKTIKTTTPLPLQLDNSYRLQQNQFFNIFNIFYHFFFHVQQSYWFFLTSK